MVSQSSTYSGEPPPFGHEMLKYFAFDPSYVNINHGSYGSVPLPVLTRCEAITRELESNPDKFIRTLYIPSLRSVRARIAKFIGAASDECVLVPNATHAFNTVLRNIEWKAGDVLIGATTMYESVASTLSYIHDTPPHPTISTFLIQFPTSHSAIVGSFRTHLRSIPRHPGQTVLAVIDGIISKPGALLPWAELTRVCKEEGVLSVIDAAHCVGQVKIDLGVSQPDFFFGNCHKWLYTKRGCAVLYVPKRNQHLIKSAIPTPAMYVSPDDPRAPNFLAQFAWTGTFDPTAYLSIDAALDFREWLGGEAKIDSYCHALAILGGQRLSEILGTQALDPDGEFTAHMTNVALPIPESLSSPEIGQLVQTRLMNDYMTYTPTFYHHGWWVRVSAQIFTEISDFEHLGKALKVICAEIVESGGKLPVP